MAGLDGTITIETESNTFELFALYSEVLGMQAENMQRQIQGQSMAYYDEDFNFVAKEMRKLQGDTE